MLFYVILVWPKSYIIFVIFLKSQNSLINNLLGLLFIKLVDHVDLWIEFKHPEKTETNTTTFVLGPGGGLNLSKIVKVVV